MKPTRRITTIALALVLAAPFAAATDLVITGVGTESPRGPSGRKLREEKVPHRYHTVHVKRHTVRVKVTGRLARVEVDQVFHNPHPERLEGIYLFPLPEEATIKKFNMYMNGVEETGKVYERSEARHIYESIVNRVEIIDPGLLEYADRRVMRMRLYPIMPLADVRIKLSFEALLPVQGGTTIFTYPLGSARFTGEPQKLVDLQVDLASKVPIKSIHSPSHRVEVDQTGDHAARVSMKENDLAGRGDFKLYYRIDPGDFGLSLATYSTSSRWGYFMLTLAPGSAVEPSRVLPKDVVFAFDVSGSMKGPKMKHLRRALAFCLERLRASDRFHLVPFSTDVYPYRDGFAPATPKAVGEAIRFIDSLEAEGATNIDAALAAAMKAAASTERLALVVFLTDGKPTIGVTDATRILARLGMAKRRVQVSVFGLGDDLDAHLLDRLAEATSGPRTYARDGADLGLKLKGFIRKVSNPVLAGARLDFGGVRVFDTYPKRIGDLFAGSQVVLFGRFRRPAAPGRIVLSGRVRGARRAWSFDADWSGARGGTRRSPGCGPGARSATSSTPSGSTDRRRS